MVSRLVFDMAFTSSGAPVFQDASAAPRWTLSSPASIVGAIASALVIPAITQHRETVFLTHAQQRAMDRALRRSVRIIA
jgi:hypothetical protein